MSAKERNRRYSDKSTPLSPLELRHSLQRLGSATENEDDRAKRRINEAPGSESRDFAASSAEESLTDEKSSKAYSSGSSSPSSANHDELPYHIFDKKIKMMVVLIVSSAAVLSGLSANVYFPVQGDIVNSLDISRSTVNLSITTFIIFQGISPSFWGPLTDIIGRRETLIYTLIVSVGANIALALSQNAAMLLIFRAVQAIGSCSTISLGAGVIADISAPGERGGYLGWFSGVRQLSLGIGPVLGGIIGGYLGFRAVFWFLAIVSTLSVVSIILLLPETLRRIAGNGSVPLTSFKHRPLLAPCLPYGNRKTPATNDEEMLKSGQKELQDRPKVTWRIFFEPLLFLFEPDVGCALFFGACMYTSWSMMVASTTYFLQDIYHFDTIQIGLAFFANGFGCMLGSIMSGRTLNASFRTEARVWQHSEMLPPTTPLPRSPIPLSFPLEKARLGEAPLYSAIMIVALLVFGWSLTPVTPGGGVSHWIVPLFAQFAVGYSNTSVLNSNNTLVIDLYPGKSASASAVTNLMKCLMAAVGVAVVEYIQVAVNPGWYGTILVGISLLGVVPLIIGRVYGMRWRNRRESAIQSRVATREGSREASPSRSTEKR